MCTKQSPLVCFSLWLAIVLFSLPATLAAQTFQGSIVGLLTDASGSAVTDATVVLTETRTGAQRTGLTNSTGNYVFAELPPGVYKVRVTRTGFKEAVSNEIELTPSSTARFDIVLAVGNVAEKIEVSATAPSLDTENAQLGTTVTQNEIVNLPANTRASMDLRYLSSSNQDGGYIAGQRSSFGFYAIDGVSGMSPRSGAWSGPMMTMSLEAVQEITQVTATPSAEFGDVATISLTTKSGTNQLHGSGFWETNNYALDASDYFSHTKPSGPYAQFFGGSIGGPVYIPRVYNGKNKTFFFFNWEEFLQPGSYNTLASVPPSALRAGDFSALLSQDVVIYDPTNGKPFPNNVVPQDRISPVSRKIQSDRYLPQPNFGPPGAFSQNYLATYPNPGAQYYPTTRVDHHMRDGKDIISARYTYRHQNEDTNMNGLPLYNRTQDRNTTNAFISETHIFSPTVVNQFRVGYSRDYSIRHGLTKGADVINDWGLQLPNLDSIKDYYGFPQVNFENFTGLTNDANAGWATDTMEYLDNVTLTRGKHTITVGGSYRHYKVNETYGDPSQLFGYNTFTAFGTQDANSNGGFDYASFLLGIPFRSGTNGRSQNIIVRYGTAAAYIQEDWRATPNLTVNLGLRWEKTSAPVDQNDMRYAFDPATGNLVVPSQKVMNTLVSPVFPKDIPIVTAQQAGFPSRSLLETTQSWGPRAGFAYRLPHRMVIRGGGGLFYTPLLTWGVIDSYAGGPFQLSQTFNNRMVDGAPQFQFPTPYKLFGSGDFPSLRIEGLQKKIRTPYTEQWNLTLEKQIGASMVARASYRGHHTLDTIYYADLNQPHASNNPDNEWATVYPNFYYVGNGRNGGSEIGHLFEVQFVRKSSAGLTFDLGYTHAKVVTDLRGSDILGWPEYSWDLRRDSGNENGISRHRFVGSAIWDIPFGVGKRYGSSLPKAVQYALGNWQTSYIVVLQSGRFLDPYCSSCPDTSYARVWGGRPDLVGDPRRSNANASMWFNPQAFAVPQFGTLGNSAPGVIVGPGLANLDFGLFKYFPIRERARLKLKMTATNFFNHPNLGTPETDISSINVGQIYGLTARGMNGSSNAMRSIVLGARIEF